MESAFHKLEVFWLESMVQNGSQKDKFPSTIRGKAHFSLMIKYTSEIQLSSRPESSQVFAILS